MSTIRERHVHLFTARDRKPETCDAALLLAAGDGLMLALEGRHFHRGEGDPECGATCDPRAALARWKKVAGEVP